MGRMAKVNLEADKEEITLAGIIGLGQYGSQPPRWLPMIPFCGSFTQGTRVSLCYLDDKETEIAQHQKTKSGLRVFPSSVS